MAGPSESGRRKQSTNRRVEAGPARGSSWVVLKKRAALVTGLVVAFSLLSGLDAATPGRRATVITTLNEAVEGDFQGVSDAGVTLVIAGQRFAVPWDSISQLSFAERPTSGSETDKALGLMPSGSSSGPTQGVARPAPQSDPQPAARSGRCQATTKEGTQCSRTAKAGSIYCWQLEVQETLAGQLRKLWARLTA
jgi:hypothetical protein